MPRFTLSISRAAISAAEQYKNDRCQRNNRCAGTDQKPESVLHEARSGCRFHGVLILLATATAASAITLVI